MMRFWTGTTTTSTTTTTTTTTTTAANSATTSSSTTTTIPTTKNGKVKPSTRQEDCNITIDPHLNDDNVPNVFVRRRIVGANNNNTPHQVIVALSNGQQQQQQQQVHDDDMYYDNLEHQGDNNEMKTLLVRQLSVGSSITYDDKNDNKEYSPIKNKSTTGTELASLLSKKNTIQQQSQQQHQLHQQQHESTSSNRCSMIMGSCVNWSSNYLNVTMLSSIFNLVNNVAGAGILTLPSGQAAGTGYIPAIMIAILLGTISAHTFILIGKACQLTHEYHFKGLWSRTIGTQTTYIVDLIILVMTTSSSIVYSGILGDVFTPFVMNLFFNTRDEHYYLYYHQCRSFVIIWMTITILFPLSMIKNLSALSFTSLLGFISIIYTTIFICYRSYDGSYQMYSGQFIGIGGDTNEQMAGAISSELAVLPSFKYSSTWNVNFTSLVLMSNYGLAYVAHYNAPIFYREFINNSNNASSNNQKTMVNNISSTSSSSNSFGWMVSYSFVILVCLYVTTMIAGYATFGDNCLGNILLNYHPKDKLAIAGRLATGFSILFGFPLIMTGARESLINVLTSLYSKTTSDINNKGGNSTAVMTEWNHDKYRWILVIRMLIVVTIISILIPDISLIVGINGATMGSCIVYICPTLIYTKAIVIAHGKDSIEYKKARWNLLLIPFGLMIASMGVYMTISGALAQ